MLHRYLYVSLCLCAFCLLLLPATSFGFNERFIGARPMGMGGAFVAVADDANTMSWNPAGLPMLQRYEFNNVWGNQDDLGQMSLYTNLIVPVFDENCALGFGWQNLKIKPISLSKGEWAFSGARRYGKWSLGGSGRSIYRDTKQRLDKDIGFKVDVGALWIPFDTMRLALVKYGMFGTDLQENEPIKYKMGLCYHPPGNKNLLFAIDKDNLDTYWGIEFWLKKQILKTDIALRLGGNSSKGITLNRANSLGANLLQIDYASSGNNSYSSISLGYEYITSLFNLQGVSLDPFFSNLFVCTYKSLEDGKIPLGTITVENKMKDVPIVVWLSIDMKEYTDNKAVPLQMELSLEKSRMPIKKTAGTATTIGTGTNQPRVTSTEDKRQEAEDKCTIPPGYIARIKMVNLPVSENILNVKGNVSISPEIKLYYTMRDEVKDITPKCGNVNICGNNGTGTYQVNWNQIGMLATFMVIEKNSFMADFMNEVKRCYLKTKEFATFPTDMPENIFKVMYLFDALKIWGITYTERRDYKTGASKDTYLRCPDEILSSRFTNGNDEDMSVLMAACMKYWDIPVGFLDGGPTKKENFMPIFSTGVPANDGTNTMGYNNVFLFNPEWGTKTTWLPLKIPKWKDNFIVICQQATEFYRGEENGKKAKEEYGFKAMFLPEESNFTLSIPIKKSGEKKLVFSDKLWVRVYEEFRIDIQKFNELSSYRNFFGEVKIEPLPETVKKASGI